MRIALATCSNLPTWEVDDAPLFAAFTSQGAKPIAAVWDDLTVEWARFDAVLIRTTWDYMEKRDAFVAWARHVESRTRLFNSARVVEWNTRKTYLRDLAERGVHIAPTAWFERGRSADIPTLMHDRGWKRGFIKPVVGATARETLRFEANIAGLAAAQSHIDRMLLREDMMVQPYLSRVELEGERSVIFIDGEISHAVQKIPVAGDYRVQDDFGAHDFAISLSASERDLARQTLSAANDCVNADLLYARCDYLIDDDDRWTLTELEVVEPSLFLRHDKDAASRLAAALISRIAQTDPSVDQDAPSQKRQRDESP